METNQVGGALGRANVMSLHGTTVEVLECPGCLIQGGQYCFAFSQLLPFSFVTSSTEIVYLLCLYTIAIISNFMFNSINYYYYYYYEIENTNNNRNINNTL